MYGTRISLFTTVYSSFIRHLTDLFEKLETRLWGLQRHYNIQFLWCFSTRNYAHDVRVTLAQRPGSTISQAFFVVLMWSLLSVSFATSMLPVLLSSLTTRRVQFGLVKSSFCTHKGHPTTIHTLIKAPRKQDHKKSHRTMTGMIRYWKWLLIITKIQDFLAVVDLWTTVSISDLTEGRMN